MDERAPLLILGVVAIVAIACVFGAYMLGGRSYSFGATDALDGGLTGNVVASTEDAPTVQTCDSCTGYGPVCAKVNNRFTTFQNECEAACANARIISNGPCSKIPVN